MVGSPAGLSIAVGPVFAVALVTVGVGRMAPVGRGSVSTLGDLRLPAIGAPSISLR